MYYDQKRLDDVKERFTIYAKSVNYNLIKRRYRLRLECVLDIGVLFTIFQGDISHLEMVKDIDQIFLSRTRLFP